MFYSGADTVRDLSDNNALRAGNVHYSDAALAR
jgi:hypothetical protein